MAPAIAVRRAGAGGAKVTPVLILVESNTTGTGRLFAERSRRLGVRPILLSREPSRYSFVDLDGVESIVTDTADDAAIAECIKSLPALPAGITSSSEYYVSAAARMAEHLRLPGPAPEAIMLCRNKKHQRLALARGGLPGPRFAAVRTVAEAAAEAESIGCPVVVKPTKGSGSVGVRRCDSESEVVEHAEKLLRTAAEILIEEYMKGPEYSIETFGGQVVSIVAKQLGPPPHFVEMGHDIPAGLTDEEHCAISALGSDALRALRLGFGAAHIEVRLTAAGPAVVEVNPRLAGGMIPELVRAATGVDMITAQLLTALGNNVGRLVADRQRHASLRFLTTSRSAVVRVDHRVLQAAASDPSVSEVVLYKSDGERVAPAVDFSGRLGHVLTITEAPRQDSKSAATTALEELRTLLQPIPERQ